MNLMNKQVTLVSAAIGLTACASFVLGRQSISQDDAFSQAFISARGKAVVWATIQRAKAAGIEPPASVDESQYKDAPDKLASVLQEASTSQGKTSAVIARVLEKAQFEAASAKTSYQAIQAYSEATTYLQALQAQQNQRLITLLEKSKGQ